MAAPIFGLLLLIVFLATAVMAVVLITLGVRGRPVFSEPSCSRCGYDLRAVDFMNGAPQNCPECGRSLKEPGAVSFGRYERRPRLVQTGVLMLVLIGAGLIAIPVLMSRPVGPGAIPARRTNAQLLAALPATANQPWDWQELERRYSAGSLSQSEVDQLLGVLIAHLRTRPRAEPLHWCDGFVTRLLKDGQISDQRKRELCESFFVGLVKIVAPLAARPGKPIEVTIEHDDPWGLANHYGVWHLRQVLEKDRPMELHLADQQEHPDRLSGSRSHYVQRLQISPPLDPGEHELTFVLDAGAIPDGQVSRGMDGRPGTPDKWPSPLARWEIRQTVKLRVLPPGESPVERITDPARHPFAKDQSPFEQFLVRPRTGGTSAVVTWKPVRTPVCGELTIRIGGQDIAGGSVVLMSQQTTVYLDLPELPPGAKADIRITPHPEWTDQWAYTPERTSVWAAPIEIKDIPIDRADLPAK